ncbi:MAG TPA: SDR family oxidoreductase [Candidatus Dormibacteraeota bacterium]|jgi:3-oxoacyl-[acyl-carrier protein] reductase|nr:SDR family oxidoreductase [Candidatus Dormibacteraeota bacterium]
MDLGLKGRRAWVLGGSSGLGRAAAASLAGEGALVAVSARDRQRLRVAAHEVGGVAVPLDLAEGADAIEAAAEDVVDELGGLDVVVFNHGRPATGGFAEIGRDQFQAACRTMLEGAFAVTKAVAGHLVRSGSGVIVYVTSSSTKEILPHLFLSNVLRLGVVGLMKSVARELGPAGVRALCVAAGRFATPPVLEQTGGSRADRSSPLGRLGDPAEFGDLVAFVASPRAGYLTGCSVVLDGGHLRAVAA